jgi:type I restriction-modification system DNA methylase subunit
MPAAAADDLLPLVQQAQVLAMQFDAVVANPPYMGARYYDDSLKRLVEKIYKPAKGDLYTCFMVRNAEFTKPGGIVGMVTIPNWMFLSSFEDSRSWLFSAAAIETFSHNGRGVFGSDFGSCAFTFRNQVLPDYKGRYKRLFERAGSVGKRPSHWVCYKK